MIGRLKRNEKENTTVILLNRDYFEKASASLKTLLLRFLSALALSAIRTSYNAVTFFT